MVVVQRGARLAIVKIEHGRHELGPGGGDALGLTQTERLLLPDEQAVEILQLIDGRRDVDNVVEELVRRYDAPREVITGDVVTMLKDLVDKKVLRR